MSYCNQKTITITNLNQPKKEDNHPFFYADCEVLDTALNDLNLIAFKLWAYFYNNRVGYTFDLSYAAVNKRYSMSNKQYKVAIQELIDKHYLVLTKGNHYNFYALSRIEKENN